MTKYTNMLQRVPNSADRLDAAQAADLLSARASCIKANWSILSGGAAKELLSEYSGFFNFQSSSWCGWRMVEDQRFTTCLDMLCVMQDAFYRLLHRLAVPQIDIFGVCSPDLGTDQSNIDMEAVLSIATRLRDKQLRCSECVDYAFTQPWVARLLDHGRVAAMQAWWTLGDVLSLLRVASTLVEKKHLVGQEAKPRKRGVCIAADEVGGFVFRKLVERAADGARDAARAACLGNHLKQFQHCLTDLLFQGHGDRRSEAAAKETGRADPLGKRCRNILNFDAKLKRQRTRGYDVFIRTNFHDGLAGSNTFEKRKSLDAQWNSLANAEKYAYNAIAETEEEEEAAHDNENFVEFLHRQRQLGEGGKQQKVS